MKKRTMLILSGTAALLAGIIFFSPDGKGERPPESPSVAAATVSDRIDYFASHGWEVEEICGKFVTIPTDFSPSTRITLSFRTNRAFLSGNTPAGTPSSTSMR